MAYRWFNMGDAVPSTWSLIPVNGCVIPYTSGSISQLCEFVDFAKADDTLSSIMQVKLYRDITNASGEFAGADAYTGDVLLVEYDIHYISDTTGSAQEYAKR
jgi:hypothetical protein